MSKAPAQNRPAMSSLAIKVMAEAGIDISSHRSKHLKEFLDQPVHTVITVCGTRTRLARFSRQVNVITGRLTIQPKPPAARRKFWPASAVCAMRCGAYLKLTRRACGMRERSVRPGAGLIYWRTAPTPHKLSPLFNG